MAARRIRVSLSEDVHTRLFSDKFGSGLDTADQRLSRALDLAEVSFFLCDGTCCEPGDYHCTCVCHLIPGFEEILAQRFKIF